MDVTNTSTYAVFYSITDRIVVESQLEDGTETLVVGNDTGPTHFVVLQDTPASLMLGIDAKYSTATLDYIDKAPGKEDEPLSLTDIAKRIDLTPVEDDPKPEDKDDGV